MNPSRRRRANSQEERCRCAECAALDEESDLDPEACMAAVAGDIQAVGWSVSAVLGDEIAPPWAYTVGMWLSHQGPELAMYGLPVEHMTVILNSIADRIANGAMIAAGDQIDGICPCSLAVRPVHASWRMTSMFAVSDRYYGYIRPTCLQVVWPDRRDRYPGEAGFQLRYEGRQPMLWLPRDDNPPGVWTRIDQLGLPSLAGKTICSGLVQSLTSRSRGADQTGRAPTGRDRADVTGWAGSQFPRARDPGLPASAR